MTSKDLFKGINIQITRRTGWWKTLSHYEDSTSTFYKRKQIAFCGG